MNQDKKIEIPLPIILFIIIIIIGSSKLISFATDKVNDVAKETLNTNIVEEVAQEDINTSIMEENAQESIDTNNIEQDNTIENTITVEDNELNSNVLEENDEKEDKVIKKDTAALSQINTKTRKTSSGTQYTSIGLINIPSLNIKYQILSSTSKELLKISVNKYWGADPNEVGNLCILGHNYKDSRFFGKLPQIKKGANIYITDLDGTTLKYKVYETDVIEPDDLTCTSQETNGNTEVTLITCYYESGDKYATKRFIVKARV